MSKDVKKKLLAVVLSICMVIGVVEIVPRAKAAGQQTIQITATRDTAGGTETETFDIVIEETEFTYDGKTSWIPKIYSISGTLPGTYDRELFPIRLVGSNEAIDSGSYKCEIWRGDSGWKFSPREISYEVKPVTVTSIRVSQGMQIPVVPYTGSNVAPDSSSVSVMVNNSIALDSSKFKLEGSGSAVGEQTATVTITDTRNFVQGSVTSTPPVDYVIAYDLSNGASVGGGHTATLEDADIGFDGSSVEKEPVVNIMDGSWSSVFSVSKSNKNGFQVDYYNKANNQIVTGALSRPGEYEIVISPPQGSTYVQVGSNYYTGTFRADFTVRRMEAEDYLIVSAEGTDRISHTLTGPDAATGTVLRLLFSKDKDPKEPDKVHPYNIEVRDRNNNNKIMTEGVDYTITYDQDDTPGLATMYIRPTSSTSYQGYISIDYYISSSLSMKKTVVIGEGDIQGSVSAENGDEPHIVYDGQPHTFDLENCLVYADGRSQALIPNVDYTLKLQYEVSPNVFDDITETNKEKKQEVGRKRIVITGHGIYAREVGYQFFWIDPIDLTNPDNRDKCEIRLIGDNYYTGREITPDFEFWYDNKKFLVGTRDDPKGNFIVDVTNNVNATKDAKLTFKMQAPNFEGTYETTFEIKPLPYDKLAIDGSYTYKGEQQAPVYKIKYNNNGIAEEFTLRPGYEYDQIRYKKSGTSDSWSSTAPTDAGDYDVELRICTSNISCGNFTRTGDVFKINKYDIADSQIKIAPEWLAGDDNQVMWTGGVTEPGITDTPTFMKRSDYVLTYANNDRVTAAGVTGSAIIYVAPSSTGSTNFTGQKEIPFTIIQRHLGSDEMNFTIDKPTRLKPDYELVLTVTDANRGTNNQTLKLDQDYEISKITYYNYDPGDIEELTEGTDYSKDPATNKITGLERAGNYEVTIKGKGSYSDGSTMSATVVCGTDISTKGTAGNYSGYVARIKANSENIFQYNGEDQFPADFELQFANNMELARDIQYSATEDDSDFTVAYERTDNATNLNQDAGEKIFVLAVGNPKKGYFGRTKAFDRERCYYTIKPAIWNGPNNPDNFRMTVSDVTYVPNSEQQRLPEPLVEFQTKPGTWVTLVKDKDYTLTYSSGNEPLYDAGEKTVTVTGIGNHAGSSDYATFYVRPKSIIELNDAGQIKVKGNPTYNDLKTVEFEIKYMGNTLVKGTDYTTSIKRDNQYGTNPIPNNDPNNPGFHIIYIISGSGNYEDSCEITVESGRVQLDDVTLTKPGETPKPGEYYVEWNKDKLKIDPTKPEGQREKIKPESGDFQIIYMGLDGQARTLKYGDANDYVILTGGNDYGTNVKPGNPSGMTNFLTIEGRGVYQGTRQIPFIIYSDITKAQTTNGSLIKDHGGDITVSKSKWMQIMESSEGKYGLVTLSPLFNDETIRISPDEYDLIFPTAFDENNPEVGTTWTVDVVGKEVAGHYYYGTKTIEFKIVNVIDDSAEISVYDATNSVRYQGKDHPIDVLSESFGNRVTVKVGGQTLKYGINFTIESGKADSLGKGTIKIKGIGNYSGEVDHDFKVTYPIAQLVVFMQTSPTSEEFVRRPGESVTWPYSGSQLRPAVKVYCPADFAASATDKEYLEKDPLTLGELYTLDYGENVQTGTGTVIIKNSENFPCFTGASGTTDNAQYIVDFLISSSTIAPPTVKYVWKDGDASWQIAFKYMGEAFTVDNLGIKLSYQGNPLQEYMDYVVRYDGDLVNVSDPANLPGITFVGSDYGNFANSSHRIKCQILPRPISDSEVICNPITMTYSDQATEQAIIDQMNIVMHRLSGNDMELVCGRDYEIENYFRDTQSINAVSAADGKPRTSGGNTYFPTAKGTYYAKIKGIGNFSGTEWVTINITDRDLTNDIKINFVSSDSSDCIVSGGEPDCTYNGREHKPAVEVIYGSQNKLLSAERGDYRVAYTENTNAGKASVTVTLGGNYSGTAARTFTIKPKNIQQTEGGTIVYPEIPEEYEFDGQQHKPTNSPDFVIRDIEISGPDNQILQETTDYTVEYQPESGAIEKEDDVPECSYGGKVVLVITGTGNYTGVQKFVYYIGEDIGDAYVQINGSNTMSTTYNGLQQLIPDSAIQVRTNSDDVLLEEPDGTKRYGYAYYKGDLETLVDERYVVDAGTYYIAVTGNPRLGTYAKSTISNSCRYRIDPRSIGQSYILVSGYDASYYYTGQAIAPKGIVVEDTDLPVTSDNYDPQRRSVKLVSGTDYDLSYHNNVSAGKATIRVTGKGNYSGTRDAFFTIISSDTTGNNTGDATSEGSGSLTNGTTTISAKDINLGFDNSSYNCMMYNGYERIPSVSINGVNVNDFTITATNNVAPGVATLIITGNGGNYSGAIYKNYVIKADLGQYGTIAGIMDQVYSGYQVTPSITLTCGGRVLNYGTDYTVTYANNINVGRATVMARAVNDSYYIGTATGGFNISNGAGGMQVTGYASAYTYTGYAITPDIIVTMNGRVLNRGTDYTVSYANNINVGTASMTITGVGGYSGSRTINFTIEAKNIENCLTTEVSNYQYNGSSYTPVITVTDSSTGKTLIAGTDYMITYSNNTNPGTAQITVTALSKNYTGTKVIPFKITSAAVSGLRTSTIKNNSIKLAWSAQSYADGYQICNTSNRVIATTRKNSYTVKGLSSYTTYKFKVRSYIENADGTVSYGNFSTAVSAKTLLNTPKLTAKASGRGRVTLTWTKIAKATGYEIYYSTSKNGRYTKLKTVSRSSKRQYVDTGLASGEKYYYTIRAYRTANGVKTYSNFNTIKSVKVK